MSHVGTALEALGKLRENVMGKGKAWLGEGGNEVHGTRGEGKWGKEWGGGNDHVWPRFGLAKTWPSGDVD
ncbi:hypothetical protein PIB30_082549, partial [Stylosanthes scabra]|nr:hypothetical protein [Stylosanthes scabra]